MAILIHILIDLGIFALSVILASIPDLIKSIPAIRRKHKVHIKMNDKLFWSIFIPLYVVYEIFCEVTVIVESSI